MKLEAFMKRKVALFANGWNGENLDEFIVGFNEYFANAEVDLFVFTSYMLTDQSLAMCNAEDSIYDLPDYSIFDAAIVFGAGMHSELLADLTQKCQEADVPVIIQGNDIPGISSVTIDNIIGMKELCDHLIEEHNVSNVVYIAGDKDNPDSNCRMQALRESLEAHGHRLNKEDIIYANWNDRLIFNYMDETYREGKKKLPDAFVCANDQMALSTLSFFKQMGIKLPEEVIVTGFDNLSAGRVFIPSLTTVDQCFKEQGMECAKFIDEASDNKKLVKKIILPSIVVPAESCGCIGCGNETALREDIICNHWSNRFIVESLHAREDELSSCILSNKKFEDIHKNMNENFLVTVGQETEDFHIYVNPQYKKLEFANLPDDEIIGPYFEPVMEVIAARTNGVVYDIPTLDTKNLFLGYDETNGGKTYVFTSLITDNYVCGYMVMGYKKDSFENKPNVKFKGCLRTTFTRFQRIIWDYYQTIKIKEQADIFLLQTVEALASAVDAKDSYTNGHSERVAKYARYIAEIAGMSEEECDEIYLAGVLHDVGKIGINDSILNKKGKLTDDEFATIKQHPVYGYDILSNIHMSHALSMGARHHHERYDGKGYPDGLKGEDIPQIARIIAVADAYDAMTSKRSYSDVIPQMQVREELLKGMGTQFDPQYAKIMIHLLDKDEEYKMKEKQSE